jgi:hypothetical protein
MGDTAKRRITGSADRERLQIYLDGETRKALRIRAIEEGTTASALVLRLITEYLKTTAKRRG